MCTEQFASVAEAAAALGVSRGRVRQLIRQGRLGPTEIIGRLRMIPRTDLARFAALPRSPGRPGRTDRRAC